MKGDNDEYAFSLSNDTISRSGERSTCALCGFVRLWNVSGCIECDRRSSRRLILLALFVLSLTVGVFAAAYYVTTKTEISARHDAPSTELERAAEDWRSHFIEAECERCPECCD